MQESLARFTVDDVVVEIHSDAADLGRAAAREAAAAIVAAVRRGGGARVVLATGNSQLAFVAALRGERIPWDRVTVFHLDEYVGIPAEHPAGFRRWIRERIEEPFAPAHVEYIRGDAGDPEAECRRYERLLRAAPVDLVCLGIGENGHLAFNEPFAADFDDDRLVRVVTLTPESRAQQVGEGHFDSVAAVPATAISLTVPALLAAGRVQACVPERRKAAAVAAALTGEIGPACPATALRRARHATVYLDSDAAGELHPPAARAVREGGGGGVR